jgi:hypothetical protein
MDEDRTLTMVTYVSTKCDCNYSKKELIVYKQLLANQFLLHTTQGVHVKKKLLGINLHGLQLMDAMAILLYQI